MNLSPSLAFDSPLDLKIKGNLLTDAFNLAGVLKPNPTKSDSVKIDDAKKYQQDELTQMLSNSGNTQEVSEFLSSFA